MVVARSVTERGMSTSNGVVSRSFSSPIRPVGPLAVAQRIPANLSRWIVILGRAPRTQLPRPRAGALMLIALTVAAIFGSMFFFDTTAIGWARRLPPWFTDAADEITNLGLSGWFLYPLGFILLSLALATTPSLPQATQGVLARLVARFGFLFTAIALPSLFATIIKRLIGRARPYVGPHDDPFAYMPFIWRPEYASMPSGHATTAAAAAVAIGAVWPRSRAVMWLYALTILLSRVVIGVHHPSDVIAGALVGVVGALMVRHWFAARGLAFAGDLQPRPGPSRARLKTAAREIVGRSPPSAA